MSEEYDERLDQLLPGDLLRWFNDRGGIEHVLVIAVVKNKSRRHPYDDGDSVLCMGRSFTLEWKDEFELLDSTLVARSAGEPGCGDDVPV